MRRFLSIVILLSVLPLASWNHAGAQQTDYAKYGRMATAIVIEDYPSEELKDYEYKGRTPAGDDQVADYFKFTVSENGKTSYILVRVTHSLKNEKLVGLTVSETVK
ncbi:DUF3889 domain-containing protein [Falsibacillus pallidus]|uniref:Uncharacterized protein DUF3889 n=1 Tax=Falsibacillus pallidus TaxID=493781 RepID=A0A370GWA5_9BACI|nr:DUF3889 domain-containing protein [Falsibacillus pallidus]RDI47932.1 uncharacterized protein DUF3889 [Falsibacillus pallidus]